MPPANSPRRFTTGAIIGAYVRWLEQHGYLEKVLARLPPDRAQLARTPPLVTEKIDARVTDDYAKALVEVAGAGAARALGQAAMRDKWMPVLQPLIDSLTAIHGRSPGQVLSRMHQIAGPLVAGWNFSYESTGESQGVLRLRDQDPVALGTFHVWEGVILALLEGLGRKVEVAVAVPSEGGRLGTIGVHWT